MKTVEPLRTSLSLLNNKRYITSDVTKLPGFGQNAFRGVASELVRQATFGVHSTFSQTFRQYARQQSSVWMGSIQDATLVLKQRTYPENLQSAADIRLDAVKAVAMLDGISLYGSPRTEIAENIIHAESSEARRNILGRKWREIANDCSEVLDSCNSAPLASMVAYADEAVEALLSGRSSVAQSLAGGILDTIITKYFAAQKSDLKPNKSNREGKAYDSYRARAYIATAPIWQAYQNYYMDRGDPVPFRFNRHATAHMVGNRQYSRRNAVQGVMIVCGLLKLLDEWFTQGTASS